MPRGYPNTIESIIERLVILENGCAVWVGNTSSAGYGYVMWKGRMTAVHRLIYEHFVGPIPEGWVIDHVRCQNPPCANFDHLEAVTHRVNVLRGTSPPAAHARKTHCPRGHEYTAANTHVTKTNNRKCRQCGREKKYAREHGLHWE